VNVYGFTISSSGGGGIDSPAGPNLDVENNVITTAGTAVDASGATSTVVSHNVITTTGGGTAIYQIGGGLLDGVTIQGNQIQTQIIGSFGILLSDVFGPVQIGGLAAGEGNAIDGADSAIYLDTIFRDRHDQGNHLTNVTTNGISASTVFDDFTAQGNEIDVIDPSSSFGISVNGVFSPGVVQIGGTAAGEANTIDGSGNGIYLVDADDDVTIQDNVLTNVDVNGSGITASSLFGQLTADGNMVGGSTDGLSYACSWTAWTAGFDPEQRGDRAQILAGITAENLNVVSGDTVIAGNHRQRHTTGSLAGSAYGLDVEAIYGNITVQNNQLTDISSDGVFVTKSRTASAPGC